MIRHFKKKYKALIVLLQATIAGTVSIGLAIYTLWFGIDKPDIFSTPATGHGQAINGITTLIIAFIGKIPSVVLFSAFGLFLYGYGIYKYNKLKI